MSEKVYPFPNAHAPGRSDWIQFVLEPEFQDGIPSVYKVDLSWMLSNWNCTYGAGCPSILINGVNQHHGCCQDGVHFGLHEGPAEKFKEHERIKKSVQELTPDDWDHGYGKDKHETYWTEYQRRQVVDEGNRKVKGRPSKVRKRTMDVPEKTKMEDGACIFANRPDGPAGKMGCAFHHLATRKGVHHSETKPDICWMMPFSVGSRYNTDIEMNDFTVTSINGPSWGPYDTGLVEGVGHWCTEIPDSFTGTEPVYKYAETDLRKIMGDRAYERMVHEIEAIVEMGGRRYKTPGETINGGRPLLPLLVRNRKRQWEAMGNTEFAAQAASWLDTQAPKEDA